VPSAKKVAGSAMSAGSGRFRGSRGLTRAWTCRVSTSTRSRRAMATYSFQRFSAGSAVSMRTPTPTGSASNSRASSTSPRHCPRSA